MKIFTSYYAKIKKIPNSYVLISIAGRCPDFYTGIEYKVLAPKYSFFKIYKENHDVKYYTKCFNNEVLSHLSPDKVVEHLQSLSNGKDVVLLCYEKPSDFCHRKLVARWLCDAGYDVQELDV